MPLHSGVAFDRSGLTSCSGFKRVCETPLPLTRGWAFWVFSRPSHVGVTAGESRNPRVREPQDFHEPWWFTGVPEAGAPGSRTEEGASKYPVDP